MISIKKYPFVRNIFANQTALIISIFIALGLTPFVIKSLGAAQYGIWILITSLTGHYGLLTFGVRGALTRYLSETIGLKEYDRASQYLSTAIVIMFASALLTIIAGMILTVFFDQIFNIPEVYISKSKIVCLIVALTAAIQLLYAPYHAGLSAAQRFDVLSKIEVWLTVVRAVLTVVILKMEFGLIGLSVLGLILSVFSGLITRRTLKGLYNQIQKDFSLVNIEATKTIVSYGSKSFLINVAILLVFEIDLFVVGLKLEPECVAIYSLGASLNNYLILFVNAIANTFGPYATRRYTESGKKALSEFFLECSKVMYILGGCIVAGCYFYAGPFFSLWVGAGYVKSGTILLILTASQFFANAGRPCSAVFSAMLKIGPQAKVAIIEGVANFLLSLFLVIKLGLLGVAFGTLIPMCLNSGIWAPSYACRLLSLSVLNYYIRTLFPGVCCGISVALICKLFTSVFTVSSWAALICQVVLVIVIFILVLFWINRVTKIFDLSFLKDRTSF